MNRSLSALALSASLLTLAACAGSSDLAIEETVGPTPKLPAPQSGLIPTMKTPKADAWAAGDAPTAPQGFAVTRFAEGLPHPRWLYVLPNGDVLAALSATKPTPPKSIKDVIMGAIMKRVGSTAPSPDRIVVLRDANGDGVADSQGTLVSGLNQPFGMALVDGYLYVGNTDALVRYPYAPGGGAITAAPEKIVDLPHSDAGHWTRNVLPSADGSKIMVAVGSASNIADGGIVAERDRANILEVDPAARRYRVFASGLRNPNGLAYEPATGALYTVVNERDMLGDDLVPDYLTSVRDGAFYGWPWSYWGKNVDDRVKPANPTKAATAIAPDYALGAHVAALGLTFYTGELFPPAYRGGAFIGEHGSWNRSAYSGYKVVYVPFANGRPSGPPQDFLTGFFEPGNKVSGRPVGVTVARDGALLVADDVGGVIWRVAPARLAALVSAQPPSA